MAAQNALRQLGAMGQAMDVMDQLDEEDRQTRPRKRRSVWVKDWLLIRDNPTYGIT